MSEFAAGLTWSWWSGVCMFCFVLVVGFSWYRWTNIQDRGSGGCAGYKGWSKFGHRTRAVVHSSVQNASYAKLSHVLIKRAGCIKHEDVDVEKHGMPCSWSSFERPTDVHRQMCCCRR